MIRRKALGILFLFILCYPVVETTSACTIFTVTDGQSIYFCGNEDNSEAFQWRIWFIPATETRHGRAFLGFRIGNNLDIPMAGINDQGLAIDLSAVSYTPIKLDPNRDNFEGAIFTKWLSDYSTVEDVETQLSKYNVIDLENNPNQIHVADKTGNAIVVGVNSEGELSTSIRINHYLVSTNYNLHNKETFEYELHHSGRYNTTATMLESLLDNSNLHVEGCRDILEEVALNPNLGYGYVTDLKQGLIYLYSHDDFKRTAVIDINKELAKGAHSYALETLVTQQTGIIKQYIQNSIIYSTLIIIIILGITTWLYLTKIKPLFHSEPIKNQNKRDPLSNIDSRLIQLQPGIRLLLAGIFFAVILVLLKTFVKIGPFYINFDWTSLIHLYITLFPIVIIATNFRPSIAFTFSSVGVIIDEIVFCVLNGYGGELWIQLILTISSLVGTTIVVSYLWKKNKFLAYVLGAVWYFIGYYFPAYLYYCVMFCYDPMGLLIYTIGHVFIYLGLIPFALLFNKIIQNFIHIPSLEAIFSLT